MFVSLPVFYVFHVSEIVISVEDSVCVELSPAQHFQLECFEIKWMFHLCPNLSILSFFYCLNLSWICLARSLLNLIWILHLRNPSLDYVFPEVHYLLLQTFPWEVDRDAGLRIDDPRAYINDNKNDLNGSIFR